MESHITATGLVLNPEGNKGLMIFHRKLQIWLPPGGHVEPGELPHDAVVREVFEETGVKAVVIDASVPLALIHDREKQLPAPHWILHELIPAYKDKPSHLHYDFIYQLRAESEECIHAEGEVDATKWLTQEELLTIDTTEATRIIYRLLLR
jgi:8-oxo-dGTP diphosphatase